MVQLALRQSRREHTAGKTLPEYRFEESEEGERRRMHRLLRAAARPIRRRPGPFAALLALALIPAACGPAGQEPADLVLRGGTVVTVDSTRPTAEALAASGDTIVAVGPGAEIESYVGPDTRVIDLDGRMAVPGFVEAHGHFMGMGSAQMQLDLLGTGTWDRVVRMVDSAAAEAEPGEWILGRGWHQEKWDELPERTVQGFPVHDRLSEVAPENPVLLSHASGHAAIANARAMELAGLEADTEAPSGGEIVRDGQGRPTGVLVDEAESLVGDALDSARADMSREEQRERYREMAELAVQNALEHGVTSFHDQGAAFEAIRMYRRMADDGAMRIRMYAMVSQSEVTPEQADSLAAIRTVGYADGHLTVRSVGEVTGDGALGSRSAWMIEPYADRAGYTGVNVTDLERIREIARISMEHGFQVAVHAIGDRANRETLDMFAALFDSAGVDGDTLRWRVEHAQHLRPEDIPRFGEMGVVASMQAMHACSDAPYVVQRLGRERARQGAYMWRALMESGAVVNNGTDVPVENIDPLNSFHCSVTREIATREESTFYPEQSMTRQQALRSYTINGAYSAFAEERRGSLEPGKLADITVLSRDIMTIPADSIPATHVDFTVVGGDVEYAREAGGGEAASSPGGT